jgi:hypothetical protein
MLCKKVAVYIKSLLRARFSDEKFLLPQYGFGERVYVSYEVKAAILLFPKSRPMHFPSFQMPSIETNTDLGKATWRNWHGKPCGNLR